MRGEWDGGEDYSYENTYIYSEVGSCHVNHDHDRVRTSHPTLLAQASSSSLTDIEGPEK